MNIILRYTAIASVLLFSSNLHAACFYKESIDEITDEKTHFISCDNGGDTFGRAFVGYACEAGGAMVVLADQFNVFRGDMIFRVDKNKPYNQDSKYAILSAKNPPEHLTQLLPPLKDFLYELTRGNRLVVRFRSLTGTVTHAFSLIGFTDALKEMPESCQTD